MGATFLKCIQDVEIILNGIGILICKEQYDIGSQAINMLKQGQAVTTPYENVNLWPSFFSGIEVISNRTTPCHLDRKSCFPVYDFLVSAGNHSEAWVHLPDIDTKLLYKPGTVIAICGKVLRHAVYNWDTGDRLCIAHFIRDLIHDRLGLPRPQWVTNKKYLEMMDTGFVARQKL